MRSAGFLFWRRVQKTNLGLQLVFLEGWGAAVFVCTLSLSLLLLSLCLCSCCC